MSQRSRIGLITILILLISISAPAASIHPVFTDTCTFRLFIRGVEVAQSYSYLDNNGFYYRNAGISIGSQKLEMTMVIQPDEGGEWKSIRLSNPIVGDLKADRAGDSIICFQNNRRTTIASSPTLIPYDDYGIIWESIMIQRYDMSIKGKQRFKRFRLPETPLPDHQPEIELEYLSRTSYMLDGHLIRLDQFRWTLQGIQSTYWVDQNGTILLIRSPSEHGISVREGFEALVALTDPKTSRTTAPFEIKKSKLSIPLRDGMDLSTDLYRPKTDQTVPIILIRTPYGKQNLEFDARYYAGHGYAVAVQDVRGRFDSKGVWEPFIREGSDGYDAVEWLASQPWCNARVALIGSSYTAMANWQTAILQPPHLITLISINTPADPLKNSPYENGCFLMAPELWWCRTIESGNPAPLTPADELIMKNLPVSRLDQDLIGKPIDYYRQWLDHPTLDDYWKPAGFLESLSTVPIPVLMISGWFDTHAIGTRLAWNSLIANPLPDRYLIIGPWNHANQIPAYRATQTIGKEAEVDFMELYLKWFDRYLKESGSETFQDSSVNIYLINHHQWLQSGRYPLPQTRWQKLYLNSGKQGAATSRGDGRLEWNPSYSENISDHYDYDPADPTPAPAYRFSQSYQSFNEITGSRRDILVYQTAPLNRPLTLAGPISATLYASSSALDTDWFITLYAVTDDNQHIPMGRGVIRAKFRHSLTLPELLEKDRVEEYTLDLWHFAVHLEKGWRLQAEVTSAWFPHFSRNLNTGSQNEKDTLGIIAHQQIHHSSLYPSHILLPVIPDSLYHQLTHAQSQDSSPIR